MFGKNNDAGVINIVTKRPSTTFGVTAEATGGNYNDRETNASVTGPLGDISAARFYAGYQKRDGFLNINTGLGPNTDNRTDDRNMYTMRGQFLITPSDAVNFLVIGDYSKRNESCCGAVQVADGPAGSPSPDKSSTPSQACRPWAEGRVQPVSRPRRCRTTSR